MWMRLIAISASLLTLTGAAADEGWRLHGGTPTDPPKLRPACLRDTAATRVRSGVLAIELRARPARCTRETHFDRHENSLSQFRPNHFSTVAHANYN